MFGLLCVGLGGFLGAIARYLLSGLLLRLSVVFPCGTFAVNILGSFGLGFLMALVTETLLIPSSLRLFLAIGFLGSFTTFSTFMYETHALLEGGEFWLALLNLGASLILGLVGVRLGWWLAHQLLL